MPENLRAYYLEQLGIENWVSRAGAHVLDSRCALHTMDKPAIFSSGQSQPKLLVVTSAQIPSDPPFTGKVGSLLSNMLQSIGLSKDEIGVISMASEQEVCHACLMNAVLAVGPKTILALGDLAGHCLLSTSVSLSIMRQTLHDYHGTPLAVSFHPVDLLLHPTDKRVAFNDLLNIQRI